jgi:hypothetical protein
MIINGLKTTQLYINLALQYKSDEICCSSYLYKRKNNNSKAAPMYRRMCYKPVHQDTDMQRSMKRKTKGKRNEHSFFFHLRTTVNRRTLVGREGRTNDERV